MYGRTFIFVENFHVNLSVVLGIFRVFNFRGTRVPTKILKGIKIDKSVVPH